jgi:hypothetical protein
VHQIDSSAYILIGWMMLGLGAEVEICVCGFAVHFVALVNISVQEGEVTFSFSFYGEMNGLVDAV